MKKFKLLGLFLLLIIIFPFNVKADNIINIHLFYGDGCPHCAEEEEFLNDYLKEEKNAKLIKYEVWHDKDNQKKFTTVQDKLDNHSNGVPYLIIGDKVLVGYIEGTTDEKLQKLQELNIQFEKEKTF